MNPRTIERFEGHCDSVISSSTSMSTATSRNDTLYFTVATAGHVDHGKTSLLRALTGTDPDRLKEEKQRGLTTDLGFAHLSVKSETDACTTKIGFVDVPGHGKFLKNMLAGVGGIDLALLVVAADEGPMPQTEQHAKILSLLGVKNILLLMTKIDVASPEQLKDAEDRTRNLLEENELHCAAVLPVSSVTKEGIDKIVPTLLTILRRDVNRGEQIEEAVYLPVDRVFSKTGYGTVITGTLVRGVLRTGDNVYIEPGALTARIRGMESFGKPVEQAQPGQRLAVNLVLKQSRSLERGQAIFLAPPTACQNLIARFNLFEQDSAEQLLKSLLGQQLRVYHGTAEVAGHLRWLESIKTAHGTELVGQISLISPLIAEPGERFVARYEDTGVTGGDILIGVRVRWLSRKKLVPLVESLLDGNYSAAIQHYIEASPHHLIKEDGVLAILPLPQRVVFTSQLLEGKLVALGEYISTVGARDALTNRVFDSLLKLEKQATEAERSRDGVTMEFLRSKTVGNLDRSVYQSIVKALIDAGKLIKQDDKLFSAELSVELSKNKTSSAEDENSDEARVLTTLQKQPCLEIKEVAKLLSMSDATVQATLSNLSRKKLVELVAYEFASTRDELDKAHQALAQIWQQKKEISPSDFKEKLGVSRKYAMALLTYFDDHNITRRVANNRVLLKAPKP
jgi:selenocysteine-specific elongation factor